MFKFQSYVQFHKTIGQVDAVVTFTEVAIRALRRDWEKAGSARAYLEGLSTELGAFVGHVDPEMLTARTNQLHIVSLVQHFEAFLRDIGDEHPSQSTWLKRKSDEPLLEYTWEHLTKGAAVPDAIRTEWDLMEYYREARSRFLHSVDKKDPKARDLKDRVARHSRLSKIGGPNSYADLRFEDFVLAARAAMAVAKSLSALGRPTDRQIAEMVFRQRKENVKSLAGLKALATGKEFLYRKMRRILESLYGLKGDECTNVITILIGRLN